MDELWRLDAVESARLIRDGEISSVEAVRAALDRLDAVNPAINAVVLTMREEALAAAAAADRKLRDGGELGPLHGVPVTTKINTDQAGCPTDNGAVAFKDLVVAEDSATVAQLRRAGAVIFGRTNAPVFSMRWFTDNALHGATFNLWDRGRTAGGSSGGAGAAVAAGIGPISQGNDIGGSVRYPAYVNGVVGLRPTIGRVASFSPSVPPGRSLGGQMMATQGPITRSIRDCRLALEVLSAPDTRDTRWVDVPLRGPAIPPPVRVGLVTAPEGEPIDGRIGDAILAAGRHLAEAGYEVEEVELPGLQRAADLWHVLNVPDVFGTLWPRMLEYGDDDAKRSMQLWIDYAPKVDLATYLAGQVERDAILTRWNAFFQQYPVVVLPSSGEPALPAGLDAAGPQGAARCFSANRFQLAIATLGLPGLSVPIGMAGSVPLGVQLIGARFREDLLLDAGEAIEAREGIRTPIDPR
jgi:amidase